jgi:hypothetical protein
MFDAALSNYFVLLTVLEYNLLAGTSRSLLKDRQFGVQHGVKMEFNMEFNGIAFYRIYKVKADLAKDTNELMD